MVVKQFKIGRGGREKNSFKNNKTIFITNMLGNYLPLLQIIIRQHRCGIKTKSAPLYGKSLGITLDRQGKIMRKLFGERLPGSKKRWYPDSTTTPTQGVVFRPSQFGKPSSGGGKSNLRRMTVLNKLFMKHVTDMLATGEVSEKILGRGLQVTRVKITPDFACVNVYWLGTSEPMKDAELEEELHRCSGILRHELSQLRLMGEVPRLHFVRDKKYENLLNVDHLLRNLDLGAEDEEDEQRLHRIDAGNMVKEELFGHGSGVKVDDVNENDDEIPAMRHDVLGLDHQGIMRNILTKMRKSKQAWDLHAQPPELAADIETNKVSTKLEQIELEVQNIDESSNKFEKFIAKKRTWRNTPERNNYERNNEIKLDSGSLVDDALALSGKQRELYLQQDYIDEEHENDSRS